MPASGLALVSREHAGQPALVPRRENRPGSAFAPHHKPAPPSPGAKGISRLRGGQGCCRARSCETCAGSLG